MPKIQSTKAQESRAAIQRLYIAMRHLFIRGGYKPMGTSGEAMINALHALNPEIYGDIGDEERVELEGLLYIFQRLPKGIEECRYLKMITREGYENSFPPLVASKRRRDCYRIDKKQMYLEMTRGRSDIYDVLTHLTFMFIESEKIRKNALDYRDREKRDWIMLKEIVGKIERGEEFDQEVGYSYLSALLGRTYIETVEAYKKFESASDLNSLFNIVYWLGYHSIQEYTENIDREITFSSALREVLGHHVHGEIWAERIKDFIKEKGWMDRPIHIVSSNMHSVMNCFYAKAALQNKLPIESLLEVAEELSIGSNSELREVVRKYALKNGMHEIVDDSGSNIDVQLFDCSKMDSSNFPNELKCELDSQEKQDKIFIVLDYAFGEQAYELMDELLKPIDNEDENLILNVQSINIMGKAGILEGDKGDIMVPNAHIFEGTADNYPFDNEMDTSIFEGSNLKVFRGPMITVLGTSLQNRDILRYFHKSSWKSIGLEMEGAHYQKAIQAAAKIRNSINEDVKIRYAYYASDNPLETGKTLASGALGRSGVKPTYLITTSFINSIINQ